MENNQKIPIIYLLGAGHSGSTLLNMIMDSHSQIFGAGELFMYTKLKRRDFFCGCGKPLASCSFWKAVFSGLNLTNLEICRKKFDFLLNKKNYFDAYTRQPINIEKYVELNEKIYRKIQKHSRKKVIFDSSKHPERAELLLKSRNLDITFLHLVRDGRGVAWSYRSKMSLLKGMRLWLMRNLKIEIIKRRNNVKYIFIRYEDFAKNPEQIVKFILKRMGLAFEPEMMEIRGAKNHQVGGNILVRFSKIKKIEPNLDWKKEMPLFYKIIFNLLCGWLNLIYKLK